MTGHSTLKPVPATWAHAGVTLRLLQADDLADTLAWRNRDEARVWFKSSAVLAMEQHQAWFQSYLQRGDDCHFIVEADGQRVGQAAVYRIDRARGEAEVGRFLAAPGQGGKGYLDRACGALLALCRDSLGLKYVYLEVFAHNERALRLYRHHGFQPEASYDGLVRMGLHLNP